MTIANPPNSIRETNNFGEESREWVLHRSQEPAMEENEIEAVGWVEPSDGYAFSRPAGLHDLIYVCLEGRGEVLVGGRWQCLEAGNVYLSPAGHPQIYRALSGIRWKNCWALGLKRGFVGVLQPALVPASGEALFHAIQGLYHEHEHGLPGSPAVGLWLDLIVLSARRVGHQEGMPHARLKGIWDSVLADLGASWSIPLLSQAASLSEESIRRISLLETGRAPMEQVTFLRMRRAASLLVTHPYSIASVASRVGYNNPMAFSTAFRRVMGVSPSDYRRKSRTKEPEAVPL